MPEWVIWSEEHRAWWRGLGFTSSLLQAGRYTEEKAIEIEFTANVGGRINAIALFDPVVDIPDHQQPGPRQRRFAAFLRHKGIDSPSPEAVFELVESDDWRDWADAHPLTR